MYKKIIFTISLVFIAFTSFGQIFEPIKWDVVQKNTGDKSAEIQIHATIEEGWHLYGLHIPKGGPQPTVVVFEKIENAEKTGELLAPSKLLKAFDANFNMELNWYINEAVFIQKIKFTDASRVKIKGYIEFMACNDKSCLPPKKIPFSLGTTATKEASKAVVPVKTSNYWTPVIQELKSFGDTGGTTGTTSLWLIFIAGLIGGFLALFTPCVWPIIPMTVSFFLKRSENKKLGQRDAILYGVAIIFIYVLLGILITLIFGASALNSLSTNAIFNLLFFGLLVVFAISFFGAFEITLPSSWSTNWMQKPTQPPDL